MRIQLEDTLAIAIDYQERLMPVMYGREELIKNSVRLLRGLNLLQVPVMLTQQYSKGLGSTIPSIQEAVGADICGMDKMAFSCIDDVAIKEKLLQYNKKNIIVCGIEAHICVLQTVVDLREMGFQVILIEDCISSRKENDKKIAINRAIYEGAVISTSESILFELKRTAGDDLFKEISRLIK